MPCIIGPIDQAGQVHDQLVTHNISAGGAYINTVLSVPVGTRLKIQIIIEGRPDRRSAARGSACVSLYGEVVRTDASGIAVEFDDQYHIFQIGKRTRPDDSFGPDTGGWWADRSASQTARPLMPVSAG